MLLPFLFSLSSFLSLSSISHLADDVEDCHEGDEPDGHHHDERLVSIFGYLLQRGKGDERERGGVEFFFLRARSLVVKLERMKNVLSKKKRLTGDILIPGESSV